MQLISIGGVAMPTPLAGGYSVTMQDLDSENTARSETGVLTRNRIRSDVHKISCRWNVTTSDLETIMGAISGQEFNVSFYFGGKYVNAKMYAGDKSISLLTHKDGFDWWDLSCNFTEF